LKTPQSDTPAPQQATETVASSKLVAAKSLNFYEQKRDYLLTEREIASFLTLTILVQGLKDLTITNKSGLACRPAGTLSSYFVLEIRSNNSF